MRKQKGFTLIELLIVIAIIGIIAAIAIPNLLNALDRSRQKRTMSDLRTWGSALGTYLVDFNFYPYEPAGTDTAIAPGVFIYDMFSDKKYLESAPYLDGWNNNFLYTPGGINMRTCQGYTIASFAKGNLVDAAPIQRFKCFQCDIRLRNGQFMAKPEGPQADYTNGQDCPVSDCI